MILTALLLRVSPRAESSPVHSAAQLLQKKAVILEQLIASISPEGAAPVIPQDQAVMVRRIVFRAVVHKCGQCLRDSHIRAFFRMGDDSLAALFPVF